MHYSTEDVPIGGYVIPKNTMVTAFLPSVHLDPERFPEPMKTRPERFLDEKSGKVVNRDMLMPFSIGNENIKFMTLKILNSKLLLQYQKLLLVRRSWCMCFVHYLCLIFALQVPEFVQGKR